MPDISRKTAIGLTIVFAILLIAMAIGSFDLIIEILKLGLASATRNFRGLLDQP